MLKKIIFLSFVASFVASCFCPLIAQEDFSIFHSVSMGKLVNFRDIKIPKTVADGCNDFLEKELNEIRSKNPELKVFLQHSGTVFALLKDGKFQEAKQFLRTNNISLGRRHLFGNSKLLLVVTFELVRILGSLENVLFLYSFINIYKNKQPRDDVLLSRGDFYLEMWHQTKVLLNYLHFLLDSRSGDLKDSVCEPLQLVRFQLACCLLQEMALRHREIGSFWNLQTLYYNSVKQLPDKRCAIKLSDCARYVVGTLHRFLKSDSFLEFFKEPFSDRYDEVLSLKGDLELNFSDVVTDDRWAVRS